MNQKEYETVVLAALLHDIGKLLQRGSFGPDLDLRAKHPEFSATFVSAYAQRFARTVDVELLKTLVQRHHESPTFPPELRVDTLSDPHARALAYLVSSADNLSAAERGGRAEEYRDFKTAAQASIFARVSLPQPDNPQPPEVLWHRPAALGGLETLANAFPRKQSDFSPGEYNRHLREFGEAFAALADKLPWDDFAVVYSHTLALLGRYGWCIPADTQEQQPDVSIFDHLKTTSAIAACLYRYHLAKDGFDERAVRDRNQERFCLVVGDLGGIQPYLFDIANIGAGGVGKRLRARSLYVQMLSDVASHRVIHRLGLPLSCVLMSSGGKFYILAPNLPETETAMSELQEQFDQWLLTELNGEMSINLAWSPFGNEFERFGVVLERASRELATRKLRRFDRVLQRGGAWRQEAFVVDRDFGGEGACRSCGKFPRERGEEVCRHCRLDAEVGGVIPKAAHIAYYDQQVPGARPLLGYSAAVQRHDQAFPANPRPYLVVQLNDAELAPLARVPAAFRYITNHIPVEDGEPLTFEQIAKRQSPDMPLLGYLKADLDFLGSIFHFGLKREEGGDFDTISRITTLSRQLDLFFSGWVQQILESTDFGECYAVFSGGDDLFVVGPWKQTVALAQRVHDDLGRYVANPCLHISAGLIFVKDSYPLARASRQVQEALDKAKKSGRDRLCLLGDVLEWGNLPSILADSQLLVDEGGPSAFLYRLLAYAEMWQRYRGGDNLGLRYQPLLSYSLTRTVDWQKQPKLYSWAQELLNWPLPRQAKDIMDHLGLIASLAIYCQRGEKQ